MKCAFAGATLLCTALLLSRGQARPVFHNQSTSPLFQKKFRAEPDSEIQVHLRASAPGRDWGQAGRESAVVSVLVDGQLDQNLILHGGASSQDYDFRVGPLAAGEHTVSLVTADTATPLPHIESAQITNRNRSEKERLVWKYVPLLYGRDDNATTDTPLVLFYEFREAGDSYTIIYSIIWSNEDGGTGNDVGSLIARWGRTTDIEWVYEITVDKKTGAVQKGLIQGAGHQTVAFQGAFRGSHAILHTVTTNNMVGETGPSRLLFALPPLREYIPAKETREAVMDSAPWIYAVAAKEMRREGRWEEPGDPTTPRSSDIRNYLNVDYRATVARGGLLAVAIDLKDGRRFFSDHGRIGDAIGRSGWIRTTVELPPGTAENEITRLAFVRRDATSEPATVFEGKVFLLDTEFRPRRAFLRWTKPLLVSVGNEARVP